MIVPVYNRDLMLSEAVGSILYQTYRDFELIIVDDGSTDKTAMIATEGLEAKVGAAIDAVTLAATPGKAPARPRDLTPTTPTAFRYLKLDHTGMPGAARNRGAEAARGRYLAFLDSDDLWLPSKLELQSSLMARNSSCPISHTREIWLRDGKIISQASQKHRRFGRLLKDSLVKCIIGPSTVMIERDLFLESGGFRDDLEIGEDYELWLKITSKHSVGYIDQSLTVKRAGHPDQLTSKYGYIEHFRIKALAELLDSGYFEGENREDAAAELLRKCAIYIDGAKKRGKFKEALQYERLAEHYAKEKLI